MKELYTFQAPNIKSALSLPKRDKDESNGSQLRISPHPRTRIFVRMQVAMFGDTFYSHN